MLLDELLDERLVRIGLGHNTSLMDFRRGALLESNFEIQVGRGPTPALRPALCISVVPAVYYQMAASKGFSGALHLSGRIPYRDSGGK